MSNIVVLTGMVLTASPIKEYDKRMELLTRERGRISVFVQGARKPNSVLSACSIPFTFGTFHLYQGRSSYNVQSAEIKVYFQEIAEDFDQLCYASYFGELVRYFTRENVEAADELTLLYLTLLSVTRGQISLKLLRVIYEMRLMMIEGEALELFACVKCGKEQMKCKIYLSQGGMVCSDCAQKHTYLSEENVWSLSHDAFYTLQYILTKPVEKLFTFRVSEQVEGELVRFMEGYLKRYINHDFKSLEFLSERSGTCIP